MILFFLFLSFSTGLIELSFDTFSVETLEDFPPADLNSAEERQRVGFQRSINDDHELRSDSEGLECAGTCLFSPFFSWTQVSTKRRGSTAA